LTFVENSQDNRAIGIAVFAAGHVPGFDDGLDVVPTGGEPGPAIHGSRSVWDPRRDELSWQWAPGAWAAVTLSGSARPPTSDPNLPCGCWSGPDPVDLAGRIADGLRTDLDQPVTAPLTMAAPPAPLRLLAVELMRYPDGTYYEQIMFGDNDNANVFLRRNGSRWLTVVAASNPTHSGNAESGPPNTEINGHPAIIKRFQDGERNVVLVGQGSTVLVYLGDASADPPAREDAEVAVARRIEPVPDPSDRSTWTDTPIH
jgi:hypothetical protein